MDADPLRVAPEEGQEKPKGAESQDDGYETSNSGEARAAAAPEPRDELPPPPQPDPPPPQPHEYYPAPYRHYDQDPEQYQHFPFPKYSNDPYAFKREPEPYDMTHHHQQHQAHQYPKRDEDMYNGIKRECEDPYSFVEEEAMSMMLGQHSAHHAPPHEHHLMHQQMMLNQPKKRGRKKKIKDENGMEIKAEPGMEGAIPRPVKERKKHDRFNGMSEEEVARRTLPDHLAENLDIIIIGINPGLFAAYKGHHYAGPGNHFWKCLYLSGLTREQMSADEDYKLLNFGIGFTNMVPRPTKGSADLTRREIKEGSAVLLEKLQTFRPKVAVFNGKLIYEVFSGKKDFCFGKQPDTIAGTNTYMWVMPSSSARCAQLPRAADKVPFYAALKKFKDYLNGLVPHVDDSELVFPDNTARRPHEEMEIRSRVSTGNQGGPSYRLTMEPEPGDTIILEDGTEVPLKKKRGRPKKVKLENGEVVAPTPRAPRAPRPAPAAGDPPKKKRGRPKKVRPEDQQMFMQQQQSPALPASLGGAGGVGGHEGSFGGALPFGALPEPSPSPLYLQPQEHDPYYHHNNGGNAMEQSNNGMDMSGMSVPRYPSPSGGGVAPPAPPAPPAAGYHSPRGAYHSPRSGYSPVLPRHQPTPQPQFPGSPAGAGSGYRSLGVGAARSPLYAASPAPYGGAVGGAVGGAGAGGGGGSPAQRFTQSPQYSRSPAPQRPYSRSPAPAGGGSGGGSSFGCGSPGGGGGGGLHSYTPSPQHTPYSQHSSPAPPAHHAPYEHHHYRCEVGGSSSGGGSGSTSGAASGASGAGGGGALCELSADIGAAISSPPASPPAVDFEPPRDSPIGSTDMHPGSNSNDDLSDYNKTNSQAGSDMSPVGGVGGVGQFPLYEGEARLPYHLHQHSPAADKDHYHYQDQGAGAGVGDSPRMDALHSQHSQHALYPNNYNRSTPETEESTGFRPPDQPHTPHHPGSPAEYAGSVKAKSVDVSSKSLSGLESLVDQIPSIADGPPTTTVGTVGTVGAVGGEQAAPAPVPSLPDYAPALYGPYSAYGGAAYGNNGYSAPFVGYGGGWGGVMRPTPGYLSEWQYYQPAVSSVPPAYPPYSAPYYNGYTPPPQQTHYLSAPPLLELHKSGEQGTVSAVPSVPSVGFGSFC